MYACTCTRAKPMHCDRVNDGSATPRVVLMPRRDRINSDLSRRYRVSATASISLKVTCNLGVGCNDDGRTATVVDDIYYIEFSFFSLLSRSTL